MGWGFSAPKSKTFLFAVVSSRGCCFCKYRDCFSIKNRLSLSLKIIFAWLRVFVDQNIIFGFNFLPVFMECLLKKIGKPIAIKSHLMKELDVRLLMELVKILFLATCLQQRLSCLVLHGLQYTCGLFWLVFLATCFTLPIGWWRVLFLLWTNIGFTAKISALLSTRFQCLFWQHFVEGDNGVIMNWLKAILTYKDLGWADWLF